MVRIVMLALIVSMTACTGSKKNAATEAAAQEELTRRQKDEIISTLPVPGAGAVGKALRASDLAKARADAHDAIR